MHSVDLLVVRVEVQIGGELSEAIATQKQPIGLSEVETNQS